MSGCHPTSVVRVSGPISGFDFLLRGQARENPYLSRVSFEALLSMEAADSDWLLANSHLAQAQAQTSMCAHARGQPARVNLNERAHLHQSAFEVHPSSRTKDQVGVASLNRWICLKARSGTSARTLIRERKMIRSVGGRFSGQRENLE